MNSSKNLHRILNIVALAILLWAYFSSQYIVFALIVFSWVIHGLITKETFLIGRVSRNEHPILYWAIQATWLLFGAGYFIWN